MKRTERIGAIIRILSVNPNKLYPLSYFCDLFQAAKSSVSEDIQAAKQILERIDNGQIETTAGAGGGVKLIPYISDKDAAALLNQICEKLRDNNRILTPCSQHFGYDILCRVKPFKPVKGDQAEE